MHLGIHHGLESKAVGSREVWAKSWDSRQKNLEAGIGNVPRLVFQMDNGKKAI
jgi:hypothetical protein